MDEMIIVKLNENMLSSPASTRQQSTKAVVIPTKDEAGQSVSPPDLLHHRLGARRSEGRTEVRMEAKQEALNARGVLARQAHRGGVQFAGCIPWQP